MASRSHGSTPQGPIAPSKLTDEDKAMLKLAGAQYRYEGRRESEIYARFGLLPANFWQKVNALIYLDEAVFWDKPLVRRLRERLESRGRARISRSIE